MISLKIRFWSKVAVRNNDECWPWIAARDRDGYGRITIDGRSVQASRAAFFLANGRWPNICRHTCDNPPCCNPYHLLDGTVSDNNKDKMRRGRARGAHCGEQHHASKISDHQREIICAMRGMFPQYIIGMIFGVSQAAVCHTQRRGRK